MIISSFIHVATDGISSFFLMAFKWHCVYIPQLYSFICKWAFRFQLTFNWFSSTFFRENQEGCLMATCNSSSQLSQASPFLGPWLSSTKLCRNLEIYCYLHSSLYGCVCVCKGGYYSLLLAVYHRVSHNVHSLRTSDSSVLYTMLDF